MYDFLMLLLVKHSTFCSGRIFGKIEGGNKSTSVDELGIIL